LNIIEIQSRTLNQIQFIFCINLMFELDVFRISKALSSNIKFTEALELTRGGDNFPENIRKYKLICSYEVKIHMNISRKQIQFIFCINLMLELDVFRVSKALSSNIKFTEALKLTQGGDNFPQNIRKYKLICSYEVKIHMNISRKQIQFIFCINLMLELDVFRVSKALSSNIKFTEALKLTQGGDNFPKNPRKYKLICSYEVKIEDHLSRKQILLNISINGKL
jgi:hypothetical protein